MNGAKVLLLAWACVLSIPGAATLVPAFLSGPCTRFLRSSAPARSAMRCRLAMSGLGDVEKEFGEAETMPVRRPATTADPVPKKVSPLIASLLEDAPAAPVRQTLSPAEMAELTAAAADDSEDGMRDQRRRATLAILSPLMGAAAFAYSRSSPADPVTVLRGMEGRSPTLQAALESGRPTVVEFYAQWCKDCKAMATSVDRLERRFDGKVNFVVLDAEKDENAKLVGLFRVDAIPHFAFISPERKLLTTLTGYVPEDAMAKQIKAFAADDRLPFCGIDECKPATSK